MITQVYTDSYVEMTTKYPFSYARFLRSDGVWTALVDDEDLENDPDTEIQVEH